MLIDVQGDMTSLAQGVVGLGGVGFIIALTNWIKGTFPDLQPRWYASVAVAWGLAINLGWAIVMLTAHLTQQHPIVLISVGIVVGLSTGLMAAGLYSGAKAWKDSEQ